MEFAFHLRYQRLRSGGGPLILSLAAGDLMVAILHILPAYSSFIESWAFGPLGKQNEIFRLEFLLHCVPSIKLTLVLNILNPNVRQEQHPPKRLIPQHCSTVTGNVSSMYA